MDAPDQLLLLSQPPFARPPGQHEWLRRPGASLGTTARLQAFAWPHYDEDGPGIDLHIVLWFVFCSVCATYESGYLTRKMLWLLT